MNILWGYSRAAPFLATPFCISLLGCLLTPEHFPNLTPLLCSAKLLTPCQGQILSPLGFQSSFSPVPTLFKGNKYNVQSENEEEHPAFDFIDIDECKQLQGPLLGEKVICLLFL